MIRPCWLNEIFVSKMMLDYSHACWRNIFFFDHLVRCFFHPLGPIWSNDGPIPNLCWLKWTFESNWPNLTPYPSGLLDPNISNSHHNCSRHPDLPDRTVAVGGDHRPLCLAEVSEGHRHRAGTWGLHWVLETAESLELSLFNGIFPTKLFLGGQRSNT